MTKTIANAAAEISESLELPISEGESSEEFRLSFARALRIGALKDSLVRLVNTGQLRARYLDGGYLPPTQETTESNHVDIDEAIFALKADGWKFVQTQHNEAPSGRAILPESPEERRIRFVGLSASGMRSAEIAKHETEAGRKISASRVRAVIADGRQAIRKKTANSLTFTAQLGALPQADIGGKKPS